MSGLPRCQARVQEPPWYLHTHACDRPAREKIEGIRVCGTHARMARRWQNEGRFLRMAHACWRAQPDQGTAG